MTKLLTALIVETNYLIASAIEQPLTSRGLKVVIATNEPQARAALAAAPIDVAIIDFRLQHADPGGLVAQLSGAGIPYIFCTASTRQEVREHFPGARVLEKPFLDELLVALVAEVAAAPDVIGDAR